MALEEPVGSAVPTVRRSSHPAARAGSGVPVVQATVRRNFLPVAVAIHGSTILSIVEEHRMEIVPQQTALAEPPEEILWPIARPVQGNKLNEAEAIWPAAVEAERAA